MATKYGTSTQTGDLGVAIVRKITSAAKAIYRPFENADIGIDGAIELLTDTNEPSGDMVLVQLKTGASYLRKGKFYVDVDKDHFEAWSRYAIPVVGIVI